MEPDAQEEVCDKNRKNELLYKLPPGKKYHIYISHAAAQETQAKLIGKALESRFLLRCLISTCDYSSDQTICDNMHHELLKSVSVLLLLSPEFFKSKLCDVEARLAVQLSYDLKFDLRIIPVFFTGFKCRHSITTVSTTFRMYSCTEGSRLFCSNQRSVLQIRYHCYIKEIFW